MTNQTKEPLSACDLMPGELPNMGPIVMGPISYKPPGSEMRITEQSPYGAIIQQVVQQGGDMVKLEKFLELQERWEANQARKAYARAMAALKTHALTIIKRKKVEVPGGAKFSHATLAEVVDAVVPVMGEHGLYHSWRLKQEDGGIFVTCKVTHELGHSEETMLIAAPDDSGKMNAIQRVASAVSYLERYTLMAILGLAAKDMDDDGKGTSKVTATPDAPEGYDNWEADMTAIAEEGEAKFTATFANSKEEFRRYATKHRVDWWATTKRKASKVKSS